MGVSVEMSKRIRMIAATVLSAFVLQVFSSVGVIPLKNNQVFAADSGNSEGNVGNNANKRIVVKYKDEKSAEDFNKKLDKRSKKEGKLKVKKQLNSKKIQVYELENDANIKTVISELKKNSNIEYVQEDYQIELFDYPKDLEFENQW